MRAASVILTVLLLGLLQACGSSGEDPEAGELDETAVLDPASGSEVVLYFPGQTGYLFQETRNVSVVETKKERVQQIAEALLSGPETRVLRAPFAGEVQLLGVDLDLDNNTAYLDFGGDRSELGGSRRELLTVYSFVNSVEENVVGVDYVGLLWNGIQSETFGGHVDTTRPLGRNESWLAKR